MDISSIINHLSDNVWLFLFVICLVYLPIAYFSVWIGEKVYYNIKYLIRGGS